MNKGDLDSQPHAVAIPSVLETRRAGILLHPTSLPGPYAGGDMGHAAYRFVELLADSGCTIWQMLPLGPTHSDGSPYQCLSVHAGNPLLISLDWLVDRGWLNLKQSQSPIDTVAFRHDCLEQAYNQFASKADAEWQQRFDVFKSAQQDWLEDYALFIAIKRAYDGQGWTQWPIALQQHDPQALQQIRNQYSHFIEQVEFEQFVFFSQWHEIRDYAHQHGVYLFGDMPIFVAHDSADVWAQRKNFLLDDNGDSLFVAGVPPDCFSETGQRWGNPLYDWDYMQQDQFDWWKQRFTTQLELFDLIRVDHFRGFEASWYIPAHEETAMNGEWIKVPGRELLQSLFEHFHALPLVAEDLGLITEEVNQLREHFGLPGMKILQFAFGGDSSNPYLPHNHEPLSVVYTGTHDNDTTVGWFDSLDDNTRQHYIDYSGCADDAMDMPWDLIRMALSSVAQLAVIPMQDVLCLGTDQRMNTPGTTEGNWQWRFDWQQVTSDLAPKLHQWMQLYGR